MSYRKCCKCGGLVHAHEFNEASETCHLCIELEVEDKKARAKEYKRKWREKNKEKVAEDNKKWKSRNKDRVKSQQKAYAKTEKGKAALRRASTKSNHRRRAILSDVPSDDWTREEIYEAYGGRCVYCGSSILLESMDADHYIPLSKGGSNLRSNIRCSCISCNRSKNDKMPEDFIGETL